MTDNLNTTNTVVAAKKSRSAFLSLLILSGLGVALNLGGSFISHNAGIPLPLDTLGTMLTAVLGGYMPGMIVGFLTNIILGIYDNSMPYYAIVNIATAALAYFVWKFGCFKKPLRLIPAAVLLSAITAVLGSVLTWYLNVFSTGGMSQQLADRLSESTGKQTFFIQFLSDFLMELADKSIMLLLCFIILLVLPDSIKQRFSSLAIHHSKADRETKKAIMSTKCRVLSLKRKVLIIFVPAALIIAGAGMTISYVLFRDYIISQHKQLAERITDLEVDAITAESVDLYLENGGSSESYAETKEKLQSILDSTPDVQYIYVYKIMEDGCHVVFDLDSGGLQGSPVGEVIPFDEGFMERVPDLLAGKYIDPIITDDTYGWLLTVYKPVYDSLGNCTCYAAVDISMDLLASYGVSFMTKLASLLLAILTVILAIAVWLVEHNVVLPVNTLAYCTSGFAYNSKEARAESVERLKELEIDTGDEIENLYNALVKTMGDSMEYVSDIQHKTETISKMQNGLIMVLADMVESRDKCTGDHVRKTAAYVALIGKEMQKRGFYKDQMTDEFIENINNAAPMHDIGKIKVSDVILNKPGKLTDEEFEIMKLHTVYGSEIIDRAIAIVPESDYLVEAKNVSMYHHEKWNGKGYPTGLAGEDIPLAARIMAVADVFDALVSQRSYKKPFTIEKALSIIKEDAGTHFDPLVAEAFLGAEEEVRKIATDFGEKYNPPSPNKDS